MNEFVLGSSLQWSWRVAIVLLPSARSPAIAPHAQGYYTTFIKFHRLTGAECE